MKIICWKIRIMKRRNLSDIQQNHNDLVAKINNNELTTTMVELIPAKNVLAESRILISKLEKENDWLVKELDSKNETIKKFYYFNEYW